MCKGKGTTKVKQSPPSSLRSGPVRILPSRGRFSGTASLNTSTTTSIIGTHVPHQTGPLTLSWRRLVTSFCKTEKDTGDDIGFL